MKLKASESTTVAVALSRKNPMSVGMRGLPGYPGERAMRWPRGKAPLHSITWWRSRFSCTSRRSPAGSRFARRSWLPLSLEGIVDAFGQYSRADWPGKVQSESDLVHRHKREAADLNAHPAPPDRDRFGGWANGPKQQATGFFRTVKNEGKWWLVDPDERSLFLWASTS